MVTSGPGRRETGAGKVVTLGELLADLESDQQFARLIDQFGRERVFEIGLATLGFPPTWMPSGYEVMQVGEQLIKEMNHGTGI